MEKKDDKGMKNAVLILSVMALFLFGCSSGEVISKPKAHTTDKFRIGSYKLKVTEKVTPDIKYHTENEIQRIVLADIKKGLTQDGLLSTDNAMDSLDINIVYHKHFAGDATPFPSDSLAGPIIDVEIKVRRGKQIITRLVRKKVLIYGGFLFDIKLTAGAARDKSDENVLIDAVGKKVVGYIKGLKG